MKVAFFCAIALVVATFAAAQSCPTIAGAPSGISLSTLNSVVLPLGYEYNGGFTPGNYGINLCTPYVPSGYTCAGHNPAYVTRFGSTNACTNTWHQLGSYTVNNTQGWIWNGTHALAKFDAGFGGWDLYVTVGCGYQQQLYNVTLTRVADSGNQNGYHINLASSAFCSSGDSCSSWTNCYSCTTAPTGNCGWCANTGMCHKGTSTGPQQGTCIAWDWLSNECPATQAPTPVPFSCSSLRNCSACTAQLCGWCATEGRCEAGSASGPSVGTCVSWDWYTNYCPATPPPAPTPSPDHCAGLTNCNSCTTATSPYCGWCASTNTCSLGTSTGPSVGSCVTWDWTSNLCPATRNAGGVSEARTEEVLKAKLSTPVRNV